MRSGGLEVVPDWICEILSPSTESKDRQIKMPIYASYGVGFAWLIDPQKQTLEAFTLEEGDWQGLGIWQGTETVAVPPFVAIQIALRDLWA